MQKAINLGFDEAEVFVAKGEALLKIGNLEQASANFQLALSKKPDFTDGALRMAVVCEKRNQLEEAKYWLEHAVTFNSESSIAYQFLGAIYLKLNDKVRAEAAFATSKSLIKMVSRQERNFYE